MKVVRIEADKLDKHWKLLSEKKVEHSIMFTDNKTYIALLDTHLLQKILLYKCLSELKHTDLRLVCKSFNWAIDQIFKNHPVLNNIIYTSVNYQNASNLHFHNMSNAREPIADTSTVHQIRVLLTNPAISMGQAGSSAIDSKAPIYTVDKNNTITFISYDKGYKITDFQAHEASINKQCVTSLTPFSTDIDVITVASGDTSGVIYIYKIPTEGKVPVLNKEKSKRTNPFEFFKFARKKNDAKKISVIAQENDSNNNNHSDLNRNELTWERRYKEHDVEITAITTVDTKRFISADAKGVIKFWNIEKENAIDTWRSNKTVVSIQLHSSSWVKILGYDDNNKFTLSLFDGINHKDIFQFTRDVHGQSPGEYFSHLSLESRVVLLGGGDLTIHEPDRSFDDMIHGNIKGMGSLTPQIEMLTSSGQMGFFELESVTKRKKLEIIHYDTSIDIPEKPAIEFI